MKITGTRWPPVSDFVILSAMTVIPGNLPTCPSHIAPHRHHRLRGHLLDLADSQTVRQANADMVLEFFRLSQGKEPARAPRWHAAPELPGRGGAADTRARGAEVPTPLPLRSGSISSPTNS
jgi:hypothetical protein